MIKLCESCDVLVGMEPIDMRCGVDRLLVKISNEFKTAPQSKTLFLFYNKPRNKLKGILWDKNGFILLYKRIERCRFKFPKQFNQKQLFITHQQLYGLLAGFDFVRMQEYPGLDFNYFY